MEWQLQKVKVEPVLLHYLSSMKALKGVHPSLDVYLLWSFVDCTRLTTCIILHISGLFVDVVKIDCISALCGGSFFNCGWVCMLKFEQGWDCAQPQAHGLKRPCTPSQLLEDQCTQHVQFGMLPGKLWMSFFLYVKFPGVCILCMHCWRIMNISFSVEKKRLEMEYFTKVIGDHPLLCEQ